MRGNVLMMLEYRPGGRAVEDARAAAGAVTRHVV